MKGPGNRFFVGRVKVLFLFFVLGMLGVAVRAGQLQILQHEELSRLARQQYLRDVRVPARRGHIYDRNGKSMAISVDVPSVYANPSRIEDPRRAANVLARELGVNLDQIYHRLASDKLFVWLKRQVTPKVAERIRSLELPGIYLTRESKRFYPNRELAGHVLGFTGVDGGGLEGLESSYDDNLAGEPQVIPAVRDARGHSVLGGGLDPEGLASGDNLRLTLDLQIQHVAEDALARELRKSKAVSGTAVVLDVETAEVLAMAVAPGFNLNEATSVAADLRRNRAITDVFEPGSTTKPFVVAAALETGVAEPGDTFYCEEGAYELAGHTIRDSHPYDVLDLTTIIQKSSNICTAKIAKVMGKRTLYETYKDIGFATKAGIRFPGEAKGLMADWKKWTGIGLATISFGQGIATSTLQLAASYRVLAAKGVYKAPKLVLSVERPDGVVAFTEAGRERRVFSEETVARVLPMMEKVVGPGGTGWRAAVPGYRVAGKTGTAQKIDPVSRGYSSDLYLAIFAGFVPANDPQVVIVVMVDEPEGAHTGGAVAAPVFADIAESAMRQLRILPSPALMSQKKTKTRAGGSAEEVVVKPAWEDRDFRVKPMKKSERLPSFEGLSARQSVERFASLGLDIDLELDGSGQVVSQEPKAGVKSDSVRYVRLVLAQE
jgi:cell division protein FtsI (penicillin-binding protein 3)